MGTAAADEKLRRQARPRSPQPRRWAVMAVPKQKKSKSRTPSPFAARQGDARERLSCPELWRPQTPHVACRACGSYRGRQVIPIVAR